MDHYYSAEPSSELKFNTIRYEIGTHTLIFTAASGVFSKGGIDFGSDLLVRTILDSYGSGEGLRILDIGCGYGAIGISLAKNIPAATVVMGDINRRAVELANINIAANKINNACAIVSDGLNSIDGEFDLIVINPPIRAGKSVIYHIFEQCGDKMSRGGALAVVIRKAQGADSASVKITEIFGNCETLNRKGGYRVLLAKNSIV